MTFSRPVAGSSKGPLLSNRFLNWSLFWNLVPFFGWIAIFSIQPHKEERFLYVIYPILCFNASIGVHLFLSIVERSALYFKLIRVTLKLVLNIYSDMHLVYLIYFESSFLQDF